MKVIWPKLKEYIAAQSESVLGFLCSIVFLWGALWFSGLSLYQSSITVGAVFTMIPLFLSNLLFLFHVLAYPTARQGVKGFHVAIRLVSTILALLICYYFLNPYLNLAILIFTIYLMIIILLDLD